MIDSGLKLEADEALSSYERVYQGNELPRDSEISEAKNQAVEAVAEYLSQEFGEEYSSEYVESVVELVEQGHLMKARGVLDDLSEDDRTADEIVDELGEEVEN